MKKIFRQFLREENGAVLIAVSVFMICAVMLGALAVDCGAAYVKAARSNTADAAVLAPEAASHSEGDITGRNEIRMSPRNTWKKTGSRIPMILRYIWANRTEEKSAA